MGRDQQQTGSINSLFWIYGKENCLFYDAVRNKDRMVLFAVDLMRWGSKMMPQRHIVRRIKRCHLM